MDCAENSYSFNFYSKVFPNKDSLSIGDTIWIEIDESVLLKDKNSLQTIDFGNATNLSTVITFNKLNGVGQMTFAHNDFSYSIIHGKLLNNGDFGNEYEIVESNKKYKLKIGVIPRSKGVYRFAMGDAANVFRNSDQCTKAKFTMYFKDTNLHAYFFKIFDPNAFIDNSNVGNVYYFKVFQ